MGFNFGISSFAFEILALLEESPPQAPSSFVNEKLNNPYSLKWMRFQIGPIRRLPQLLSETANYVVHIGLRAMLQLNIIHCRVASSFQTSHWNHQGITFINHTRS